jgi:hypothetical protein
MDTWRVNAGKIKPALSAGRKVIQPECATNATKTQIVRSLRKVVD